ncbi:Protocadherin alpha-2 [Schistosoma japonicum]|nr:Protocadherin alpha-2 [Schistosoma japonicum]
MYTFQYHYQLNVFIIYIQFMYHMNCNLFNQTNLKELFYSINEESEIGSYIGNVKLDSERKFSITTSITTINENNVDNFELYDDTNKNLFRIDKINGKLFVASRIDREIICPQPDIISDEFNDVLTLNQHSLQSLSFTIMNSSNEMSTKQCQIHLTVCISRIHWINIIITINDINDHAPYFQLTSTFNQNATENSVYIVNVSESINPGYEIPLMIAKDPDEGMNSIQSYSLRGSDFDSSLFSLSYRRPYSLNLVILGELDAETKNTYNGELIACDGGQIIPKCCNQPFQVHVTDINDNKPTFNQTVYDIEILENTTINSVIIQVSAMDADSHQNSKLSYTFGRPLSRSSLEHFTIDSNTGEVRLTAPLDAKDNTAFILPIIAEDSGTVPLVGQTVIRITVKDTNNHDPWTEIRPTHEAYLNKLSGNNNLSNNKNKTNKAILSINENQSPGTDIGLVIAGDDDVGDNSIVTCSLKYNTQDFKLDHANSAKGREIYRLSTNKSFDRETVADGIIKIVILCQDNGKPSRTSEQMVLLNILDVNEYRPIFSKEDRFIDYVVPENQPLDTVLLQIHANDADSTPKIQYYISQEAQSYFYIDPNTGVITTKAILDREIMPQIRFLVYATDEYLSEPVHGNYTSVANITIHLTDINDNNPELVGSKVFQLVENRPGFSDLVGQLTSIDQDAGNNGTVHYKLISVSDSKHNRIPSELFMINSESGKIFATRKLDREENSQFELSILLHDLGTPIQLSSTVTVIVNILDENDNLPQWEQISSPSRFDSVAQIDLFKRPHMIGLGEVTDLGIINVTTPIYRGQPILVLSAKDADDKPNANLTFQLIRAQLLNGDYIQSKDKLSYDYKLHSTNSYTSTNTPYFVVVAKTGELVAGPGQKGIGLTDNGVYELYIRVCDNGNPPLDSHARLFLQLYQTVNSSFADKLGEKWFLGYLLTNGHLGIMLVIILLLIMCLTSICLIIVFISIRRRSCQQRQTNRKLARYGKNTYPLQLNGELLVEENINLDGTLSNCGKCYHSPIMNTIYAADGESLCKWNPECGYTVGNFGPPPIYNLCAFNTLDRMRSSRTDSDKSSSALVSSEFPCPMNHYCEERPPIINSELTANHAFKSPHKCISKNNTLGSNNRNINDNNSDNPNSCTEACLIHTTMQSESNDQLHMNVTVLEIDGGSADSGQGASEEEPVNHELSKLRAKYARPYNSKELLLTKTYCIPISSNGCIIDNLANKNENHYTVSESNQCTQTMLPTMNTFINPRSTLNKQFIYATHNANSTNSQNQSPISNDKQQPRWRKPLFSNTDLGHHNHLFDEFPLTKISPGKYTSTLPSNNKANLMNHVKLTDNFNQNHSINPHVDMTN